MGWIRWIIGRVWAGAALAGVLGGGVGVVGAQPGVLDRVGEGAGVVVVVESISRLDENAAGLLTAIDLDSISTLAQALEALKLSDGLDLRGSAAGVFTGAEGKYALLLPVTDFAGYMRNLKGAREGAGEGGVYRFVYAGTTYFARDLGESFAVFGPDQEIVAAYDGRPGNAARRLEWLGARGREVARSADIVAITPEVADLLPLLEGALAPMLKELPPAPVADDAATQGEGEARETAVGALDADPRARFAAGLLERIRDQSAGAVLGIRAGPLGVRLDLVIPLREGTELWELTRREPARSASRGARGALGALGALPRLDYLFLGSLDLTHPGMRRLFGEALASGPDADATEGFEVAGALVDSLGLLQGVDRASVGVYTPENLIRGVLSRTVVAWEAADPSVAAGALRSFLRSLDGKPAPGGGGGGGATGEGLRLSASVTAMNEEPGLEEWRLGMPTGAEGAGGGAGGGGASLFLLGFGDRASGYLGTGKRGGFITWSRDEPLMIAALESARGTGAGGSAGEDALVRDVGSLLPEDRVLEWYLNARPIFQQLAPLLAMMGAGAALPRTPAALAPIGVSISLADSSLHASAFVPAPLLKVGVGVLGSMDLPTAKRVAPGGGRAKE